MGNTLDFNLEEYERIKHRKEQLEQRIKTDVPGPERETAERILKKVSIRLREYEETHTIPTNTKSTAKDYSYSSSKSFQNASFNDMFKRFYEEKQRQQEKNSYYNPNPNFKWYVHFDDPEFPKFYNEETRSEEQLIKDLGILYLIFGSTYQTYYNYHVYKIRFIKQLDKRSAFFRVSAIMYEDDVLIMNEFNIGFWPFHYGDDRVGDMEWSSNNLNYSLKYEGGCLQFVLKALYEMQDLWNAYFDEPKVPLISDNKSFKPVLDARNDLAVTMTRQQRINVIRTVEKAIKQRNMPIGTAPDWITLELSEKKYPSLENFLENSGVVYAVTKDSVLIWDINSKTYKKLINYGRHHQFKRTLILEVTDYPF